MNYRSLLQTSMFVALMSSTSLIGCANNPQGGISAASHTESPSDQTNDSANAPEEPNSSTESGREDPTEALVSLTFDDICSINDQGGAQCIQGLYNTENGIPAPLININPNGTFCLNPASAFIDLGDPLGTFDEAALSSDFINLGECNPPQ